MDRQYGTTLCRRVSIGGDIDGDMEQPADNLWQNVLELMQSSTNIRLNLGRRTPKQAVARALINHPLMILADEPLSSLPEQSFGI